MFNEIKIRTKSTIESIVVMVPYSPYKQPVFIGSIINAVKVLDAADQIYRSAGINLLSMLPELCQPSEKGRVVKLSKL
jgi:hypothetical protein